jgi:6-pyruvoyltetrahydropterin/6-carboxytetrahydropterin synthase
MFEVSIRTRFSAAHHLEGYPGSCAAHHGHNWEVEVYIRGEELDATGILVDFREIKAAVLKALEGVDHADLNRLADFAERNPTSENIARFLFRRVGAALDDDRYHLHRVAVYETPETRAVYWE